MNALFVYDPADLNAAISGGVQLCSREFLDVVGSAADKTQLLPVTPTRQLTWRVRRRLGLGAYLGYDPAEAASRIAVLGRGTSPPTHIFVNRVELLRLAPLFRRWSPAPKVVIMSHGNQSGDDLYEIAGPGGRQRKGWANWRATWKLGRDLAMESASRHMSIDTVCVMTAEEAVLERWLGARHVHWVPRVIIPRFLNWQPRPLRVGYVGTLDHTPNRVALDELTRELDRRSLPRGFELRLVGGPEGAGRALAARYPFVTYLGRLDDAALNAEAGSWSLFLNPIFWLSRGASMKLGQAVSWGLPTVSTVSGARGYRLPVGIVLSCADRAVDFAQAVLDEVASPDSLHIRHQLIRSSLSEWPGVASLARELREALV